jgi:hypothetical protein
MYFSIITNTDLIIEYMEFKRNKLSKEITNSQTENKKISKIFQCLLEIPLIRYIVLDSNLGKENEAYKLKDIPNYKSEFQVGDKIRYDGPYLGVLDSEPSPKLGYKGFNIENNIEGTDVLEGDSGLMKFGDLKVNQTVGEVKGINLDVMYGSSPECLVEFNIPYTNKEGIQTVTLVKFIMGAGDLKKVN